MNEHGSPRDDDAARAEALFRYRVIAPLLDEPAHAPLRARVAEVASHRHPHPSRGEIAISIRTLWTWLERFRGSGIDALRPRHRRDHGTLRALDAAALDRAEALRRALPARWTSTVIDILEREGTVARPRWPTARRSIGTCAGAVPRDASSSSSVRSPPSRCGSTASAISGSATTTTGRRC